MRVGIATYLHKLSRAKALGLRSSQPCTQYLNKEFMPSTRCKKKGEEEKKKTNYKENGKQQACLTLKH
jgi:hypothetical protein